MKRRERATEWASAWRQVTGFSGELVDKMIDNRNGPTHVMLSARLTGNSSSNGGIDRGGQYIRPQAAFSVFVAANDELVGRARRDGESGDAGGGRGFTRDGSDRCGETGVAADLAAGADRALRSHGAQRDRWHARA